LIEEVGPSESLAALLGLVLVGFATWIFGRTRSAAAWGRRLGTGFGAVAAVAAILVAASFTSIENVAARVDANTGNSSRLAYEPFSLERLTALNAAGKPVFINLTASWCITCLLNERVALDNKAVQKAFAAHGIVPLKGDWTTRNPEITDFLRRFGRSGVPLYVLYDGVDSPIILPQILTSAIVLDAIGKT